ncbi:MAG TPA: primosomal protein N', partial [Ruminococcaceae bacterium]|nr:primosomal protein N' [Oscillospiraceae bacterium]
MKMRVEYSLAKPYRGLDLAALDGDERRAAALLAHKSPLPRDRFLKALGLSAESGLPERMVKAGLLLRNTRPVRRIGDATRKMVRLISDEEPPRLTPKQKNVFRVLRGAGGVSVREVCYFAGVTPAVVGALVKKGAAQYYDAEVYRNPYGGLPAPPAQDFTLSEEQRAAFDRLYRQYRSGKGGVSLLYGVTGSGKTSVFMRVIDRVRADGRGVIVMVPEISLTPQTVALFRGRFGSCVAVFHSGLTLAERMDEWKRVRNGDASIVVGTRSAVFAPLRDIGLIVMDEEQEGTYKSESSPRYHARDVAKYR